MGKRSKKKEFRASAKMGAGSMPSPFSPPPLIPPLITFPAESDRVLENSTAIDIGCQHAPNVEKLRTRLAKSNVIRCLECSKVKSAVSAARDRKGKGKGVRGKNLSSGMMDEKNREKLWICLSCGLVGCGGLNTSHPVSNGGSKVDMQVTKQGAVGSGHAWQHWLQLKHPLVMLCGEEYLCWCFACEAFQPVFAPESVHQATVEDSAELSILPSRQVFLQDSKELLRKKLIDQFAVDKEDTEPNCKLELASDEHAPLDFESSSEEKSRIPENKRVIKGLINLGNTCFFNSVMQNLLSLDLLRSHYCPESFLQAGALTSSLRKFFQEASVCSQPDSNVPVEAGGKKRGTADGRWSPYGGTYNPKGLLGAICSIAPRFKGFQQHDSHELLRCLLEGLHMEEESAREASSKSMGGKDALWTLSNISVSENTTKAEVDDGHDPGNRCEDQNNKTTGGPLEQKIPAKAETFVERVFGGQLSSTVTCCECGHSSVVYESFLDLSLPIPSKKRSKRVLGMENSPKNGSVSGRCPELWNKVTVQAHKTSNIMGKTDPGFHTFPSMPASLVTPLSLIPLPPLKDQHADYMNGSPGLNSGWSEHMNPGTVLDDTSWLDFLDDSGSPGSGEIFQCSQNPKSEVVFECADGLKSDILLGCAPNPMPDVGLGCAPRLDSELAFGFAANPTPDQVIDRPTRLELEIESGCAPNPMPGVVVGCPSRLDSEVVFGCATNPMSEVVIGCPSRLELEIESGCAPNPAFMKHPLRISSQSKRTEICHATVNPAVDVALISPMSQQTSHVGCQKKNPLGNESADDRISLIPSSDRVSSMEISKGTFEADNFARLLEVERPALRPTLRCQEIDIAVQMRGGNANESCGLTQDVERNLGEVPQQLADTWTSIGQSNECCDEAMVLSDIINGPSGTIILLGPPVASGRPLIASNLELEGEYDGIGSLFEEEEVEGNREYGPFPVNNYEGQYDGSTIDGNIVFDDVLDFDKISNGGRTDWLVSNEDMQGEDIEASMSLEGCLQTFTKSELLSGENAWACENCSSKYNGEKLAPLSVQPTGALHKYQVRKCSHKGQIEFQDLSLVENNSAVQLVRMSQINVEKDNLTTAEHSGNEYSDNPITGALAAFVDCEERGSHNNDNVVNKVSMSCNADFAGSCAYASPTAIDIGLSAFSGSSAQVQNVSLLNKSNDGAFENQADFTAYEEKNCTGGESVDMCSASLQPIDLSDITGRRLTDEPKPQDHASIPPDSLVEKFGAAVDIGCHKSGPEMQTIEQEKNCNQESTFNLSKTFKQKKSKTRDGLGKLKKVTKQDASKRLLISRAPQVLTIQLKRFTQDMKGQLSKLSGHVAFQEWLDLHQFLDQRHVNIDCTYRLIGTVEHAGTLKSGHYVAFVRGPPSPSTIGLKNHAVDTPRLSSWYYISDSHVHETNLEAVLQSEAYLLFYEKVNAVSDCI